MSEKMVLSEMYGKTDISNFCSDVLICCNLLQLN